MKACVATGERGKMEYKEVPTPSLEPGMLLLKTKYACICGSDLEYLDGPNVAPGVIRGHEFVAEVVEVGEGVTEFAIGDRVVPLAYAGGSNYRCWAEYFVAPPIGLQRVPNHVSNEEEVFVEPLCTGMGSVEASGLKPGQSGVIIGVGRLGLLAVMSAKLVGAAPVIAIDIVQSHLDKALELGADAAFNANEVDVVSEVRKLTEGGPHAAILLVRSGNVLNQAVEMCRPDLGLMSRQGSTIVVAGHVLSTEVIPGLWMGLRLVGVWSGWRGYLGEARNMMALALYLVAHKQIDPKPLISEIMPMEDIQRAIDSRYSGENIAVLLRP